MKALSLWQPWATLWACGAKKFETRSWATKYRGPIAIHAALKNPHEIIRGLPINVQKAMFESLYSYYGIKSGAIARMSLGCIIATAELVNCWRIVNHPGADVDKALKNSVGGELEGLSKHHPDFGRIIVPSEKEMMFGDWTPGRYAWEVAKVEMLEKPIPIKGRQGLWIWEPMAESDTGI